MSSYLEQYCTGYVLTVASVCFNLMIWCTQLLNPSSGDLFPSTQTHINYLVWLTVETGAATSVCALTELLCFQLVPKTNLHILLWVPSIFFVASLPADDAKCSSFISSDFYHIMLMISLNSRPTHSAQRAGQIFELSTIAFQQPLEDHNVDISLRDLSTQPGIKWVFHKLRQLVISACKDRHTCWEGANTRQMGQVGLARISLHNNQPDLVYQPGPWTYFAAYA